MRRSQRLSLVLPFLAIGLVAAVPVSAGGVSFSLGAGFSVGNVAVHLAYAAPAYGYLPYYYRIPIGLVYPGYACADGCLKSASYWYHAPSCPLILFHFSRYGYQGYLEHYRSHEYHPSYYGHGYRSTTTYYYPYPYRYPYRQHHHSGHHGGYGRDYSGHYGSAQRTRPSYRSWPSSSERYRSHDADRSDDGRYDSHRARRSHDYRSDDRGRHHDSSVRGRSSRGRHGDDRSGKARRARPRDH